AFATVTATNGEGSLGLQPDASQLAAVNATGPLGSDQVDHETDAVPFWTSTGEPIGVAPAKNCTRGASALAVICTSPHTAPADGCEMLGNVFERVTAMGVARVALQAGVPLSQSAAVRVCAPFGNDQLDHPADAMAG